MYYTPHGRQDIMLRSMQGEIAALNNAGRLPASAYEGATMYTTLSPCDMCTGACLLYKVKRVVLGENNTFVGGEDYLKQRGVEVINVKSTECEDLMKKFIKEHPGEWWVSPSTNMHPLLTRIDAGTRTLVSSRLHARVSPIRGHHIPFVHLLLGGL